MRIAVTLVIDMTDEQVADYADDIPLLAHKRRARDIVESVRDFYLTTARNAAGTIGSGADISIKR